MNEEKPKFVARKAVSSRQPRIEQEHSSFQYRKDPRSVTTALVVMIWIVVVFAAVQFFITVLQLSAVQNKPPSRVDPYDFSEIRQWEVFVEKTNNLQRSAGIVAGLSFVVKVIAAVLFLMWVLLASSNAWGFVGSGMKTSPGWAIIWFLVPIANLIRPHRTMQELWKVSADPKNWRGLRDSRIVTIWWAVGLFGVALFAIKARLLADDWNPAGIFTILIISILTLAHTGLLAWMTIRVVMGIVRNQDALVGTTERMRRRRPAPVGSIPDSW